MIHTNELMLGNWVEYATGLNGEKRSNPMYVIAIDEDEALLNFDGNEADPLVIDDKDLLGIPITAELLEKCGFKEYRRIGGFVAYSDLSALSGNSLFFDKGEYRLCGVDRNITFLHELQNAYFMMEKKHLKINL